MRAEQMAARIENERVQAEAAEAAKVAKVAEEGNFADFNKNITFNFFRGEAKGGRRREESGDGFIEHGRSIQKSR